MGARLQRKTKRGQASGPPTLLHSESSKRAFTVTDNDISGRTHEKREKVNANKSWYDGTVSQQRGRVMRLELAVRQERATQWWARILWSALYRAWMPRMVVRCVELWEGGEPLISFSHARPTTESLCATMTTLASRHWGRAGQGRAWMRPSC
jgi:hypothetical protein